MANLMLFSPAGKLVSSLLCGFVALLVFQFIIRKISSVIFIRRGDKEYKPPLAPHSLPILGHSLLFLTQQSKLSSVLSNASSDNSVIRFKIPFNNICFIKGPAHVRKVLSDPATFDFEPMKNLVLKRILNLPQKIIDLANQDDSGVSRKPISSSINAGGTRFNYMERQATRDFTRPPSHTAFFERFEANLYQEMKKCTVNTEWVEYADLFHFIRSILFRATTNAFYGPHLLEISPQIEQDFWEFDDNVPFHAKGLPNVFNWQARKIRTRCIQALRKWRKSALKHEAESLPEWNEVSGLKANTLRKEVFDQFAQWDETSCAASDLAVLFGVNSNPIRASFWFFLEILRSTDLAEDAAIEIDSVIITSKEHEYTSKLPRFDHKKLLRLHLLQSVFAETLRTYVAVMMVRTARRDCTLGDWTIKKGQQVAISNYTHHREGDFQEAEDGMTEPLNVFWGRRFLSAQDRHTTHLGNGSPNSDIGLDQTEAKTGELRFTDEGLAARFLPFGMGERLCPGRHFAKSQALLTFALMSKIFDIKLLVDDGWDPIPDWNTFGYGTLPPAMATPFRIRRKPGFSA